MYDWETGAVRENDGSSEMKALLLCGSYLARFVTLFKAVLTSLILVADTQLMIS